MLDTKEDDFLGFFVAIALLSACEASTFQCIVRMCGIPGPHGSQQALTQLNEGPFIKKMCNAVLDGLWLGRAFYY